MACAMESVSSAMLSKSVMGLVWCAKTMGIQERKEKTILVDPFVEQTFLLKSSIM